MLNSKWGFGVLGRSEEHTSELQSRRDLVCRLLLEKIKYFSKYDCATLLTVQRLALDLNMIASLYSHLATPSSFQYPYLGSFVRDYSFFFKFEAGTRFKTFSPPRRSPL